MDNRLDIRYIVVKLSDLSPSQERSLMGWLYNERIAPRDCVVVEEDWPMYKSVVDIVLSKKEDNKQ